MGKLLLMDCNNLMGRVGHTHQDLQTPEGVSTGVIYGVLRTTLSLMDKVQPDRVYMVWDGGHSKRRLEISKGQYKQNRREAKEKYTPAEKERYDDRLRQAHEARRIGKMLGLHQVQMKGCEADDIIALAALCVQHGHIPGFDKSVIVTMDKDYLQLVSDSCSVLLSTPKGYAEVTPNTFPKNTRNKDCTLGFPNAGAFLVRHAVEGDSGDFVPGVSGFGRKTTYKVLEGLGFPETYKDLIDRAEKCEEINFSSKREYTAAKKLLLPENIRHLKTNFQLVSLFSAVTDPDVRKAYPMLTDPEPLPPNIVAFEEVCMRLFMMSFVQEIEIIEDSVRKLK